MPHPKEAPDPPKGELQAQKQAVMQKVKDAEIVIGQYPNGETTVFYGREWLQAIIKTGQSQKLRALTLDVDPATDDIEFLAAACQVLKGKCDYHDG